MDGRTVVRLDCTTTDGRELLIIKPTSTEGIALRDSTTGIRV